MKILLNKMKRKTKLFISVLFHRNKYDGWHFLRELYSYLDALFFFKKTQTYRQISEQKKLHAKMKICKREQHHHSKTKNPGHLYASQSYTL